MTEKNKISIIIPAYNVAKYLKNCLSSIIYQTYKNIEIIIIDDGSTDDTLKIARQFSKKDQRLKVFHQTNQGLSSARNYGIKMASGHYIALIDGDDAIAPNFISKLAEYSNEADIVVCGYRIISHHKTIEVKPKSSIKTGITATIGLLSRQEDYDIIACNKLYKKELFFNIKYPIGELHEDNLTTYKLYAAAKKIRYVPDTLYFYYKHADSITTSTKKIISLRIKQQAAEEAIAYFSSSLKLRQAAEVSFLLSQFALLDHSLRKEVPPVHFGLALKNIRAYHNLYNPYLSKRLRLYLYLIKTPGAYLYRLFRAIKPR